MTEPKMLPGAIVELKDGFQDIYPLSFPGARAEIADYTVDPDGFEKIKVIWDRSHYRYSEERNMWTYASHFKVIQPAPMNPPKQDANETPYESKVYKSHKLENTEAYNPFMNFSLDADSDKILVLKELLKKAYLAASEGVGFMMITLTPDIEGNIIPMLYAGALDEDYAQELYDTMIRLSQGYKG